MGSSIPGMVVLYSLGIQGEQTMEGKPEVNSLSSVPVYFQVPVLLVLLS